MQTFLILREVRKQNVLMLIKLDIYVKIFKWSKMLKHLFQLVLRKNKRIINTHVKRHMTHNIGLLGSPSQHLLHVLTKWNECDL